MNPIERPRTKRPLRVPIFMYSAASSGVKAPEDFNKSQKETAIAPSTLRIKAEREGELLASISCVLRSRRKKRLTVLLGRGDFLNSESVVELQTEPKRSVRIPRQGSEKREIEIYVLSRREVVANVVLDEFDTEIG